MPIKLRRAAVLIGNLRTRFRVFYVGCAQRRLVNSAIGIVKPGRTFSEFAKVTVSCEWSVGVDGITSVGSNRCCLRTRCSIGPSIWPVGYQYVAGIGSFI